MVCDISWTPTIYTGVDTPLGSSMGACVRLIHHCTSSNGITSVLAIEHSKDLTWVDGWKLAYFLLLPQMVCYRSWAPTIHTSVDTPLNLSMGVCVRLTHHCTVQVTKQGGHIYTGHTTPEGCTMGGWIKLGHFWPLPWMVCDIPWLWWRIHLLQQTDGRHVEGQTDIYLLGRIQ